MTVQNGIRFIRKLQDKAEKVLTEAHTLYKEGLFDGAISRAYYSMFYLAQAVLATKDISRRKHSAVHAAVGEHFAKKNILPRELHNLLLHAFLSRQDADYEVEVSRTKREAKDVLTNAKEFSDRIIPFLKKWIDKKGSE